MTLKYGSSGSAVATLQADLKRRGYFNHKVTGYFGPITRAAVKAFERNRKLPVDGFVTEKEQKAIHQAGQLKFGSQGNAVVNLQANLRKLGLFKHQVTGYFGSITRAAVKAYEAQHKLKADGVVGASDMSSIAKAAKARQPHGTGTQGVSTPESPATTGAGRTGMAAQYERIKAMIKKGGGKFKSGVNQMNLLGIRTNTSRFANGGAGRYDDKLVMAWKDSRGRPHVKTIKYNAEPANDMASYSSDVNGDGRPDQGRIPTGFYEYSKSSWKNGFCLRSNRDFAVERDMNHDGRFNDSKRTSGGATMLFHRGGSSGTYSAGCQTFSPREWSQFVNTVQDTRGTIGYTLING